MRQCFKKIIKMGTSFEVWYLSTSNLHVDVAGQNEIQVKIILT